MVGTHARLLQRRQVLAGLAALGLPLGLGTVAFAQQSAPTAITDGDCTDEPSVQMLFDWRAGKPVYTSVADAGPPITWVPSNLPVPMLPYLIPPKWRAVAGWCDSITQDGVPNWVDTQMAVPWMFLARVLSPETDAAFEYISGNIQGQPLSPRQVSIVGQSSVLGANPRLDPVCTIDASSDQLAPSYFAVDHYDDSLIMTSVTALGLPDVYLPATTVSITTIFGPRKDMEDLMHDVFLRILFQFLGGGGSYPTPTPTPF